MTTPDAVHSLQFETVTVDAHGEIVAHRTCAAQVFAEELGGGVALELVSLPGGSFLMGSRAGQGDDDERPAHSVRVAPFWLGRFPITQAQWQAVLGKLPPCRCRGAQKPVDRVSWEAARTFGERLAAQAGRAYRLPSEAEWEYACRAGTLTPFAFGETLTTDLANYVGEHTYRLEPKGIYRHQTTEVGEFPPNAFGLCEMHGTVWEWCADAWHASYVGAPADGRAWEGPADGPRVLRGGCWHDPPGICRSATRLRQAPREGEDYFGFRVALTSLDQWAPPARSFVRRLGSWLRR